MLSGADAAYFGLGFIWFSTQSGTIEKVVHVAWCVVRVTCGRVGCVACCAGCLVRSVWRVVCGVWLVAFGVPFREVGWFGCAWLFAGAFVVLHAF